ncbi:hypothetical protein niasHS_002401 [Heterodera schachtii]|uniref:Uncharacterized protein n=1 Tax=Heterodera schachtii TaxID=97005 RepID=A0ABD2KJV1_HETSC
MLWMRMDSCLTTEPSTNNEYNNASDPHEFSARNPLLVIAKHSFKGRNNDELSFDKNNVISVTQKLDGGWFAGRKNWLVSFGFRRNKKQNQQKIANLFVTLTSIEEAEKILECCSLIKSLSEFITVKNDILKQFEEQIKKPLNSQLIGKIFLDVELRTILFTYCKGHCDFMDFINRDNEAVQRLISLRNIDLKQIVIGLSLVFRHVDKYANILQEIERNTPEGHPDKGNLYRASLVYADFYSECERIRRQREAQLYFMQSEGLEEHFGRDLERSLGPFLFLGKVTVAETDKKQGTEVDRCVAIFGRTLLLVEHCSATDKNALRNQFETKNLSIRRRNSNNEIQMDELSEKGTKLTLRTIGRDEQKQIWDAMKKCEGIHLTMSQSDEQQQTAAFEEVGHGEIVDSADGARDVTTELGSIRLNHHLEMILPGDDFSGNAISCDGPSPPALCKPFSGWTLRPFPPHRAEWLPNFGRAMPVKMRKGLSAEEQEDALMLKIVEGYCVSGTNCVTNSHFCGRKTHEQRNSVESFYSHCGGAQVRRAASYPDQHEISVRPQLIVAEDEKLFVEELEGDQFVVKERSLVDTVYSLKDQISVLTKEVSKMAKALEQEQRTRRRLEEMVTRQTAHGTVKAQNGEMELSQKN